MNYPKRGTKSEDGRLYTHTDGSVHEVTDTNCQACTGFLDDFCSPIMGCQGGWARIEGAFVPTDEVLEACAGCDDEHGKPLAE